MSPTKQDKSGITPTRTDHGIAEDAPTRDSTIIDSVKLRWVACEAANGVHTR